ncbi:hypothetical protein [Thalassobaculum sp.]|uniref:hypothetical protein n=1 Tax=Thalassobaculum sp. TaxID=2022740 RepID=UPI003B5B6DD9
MILDTAEPDFPQEATHAQLLELAGVARDERADIADAPKLDPYLRLVADWPGPWFDLVSEALSTRSQDRPKVLAATSCVLANLACLDAGAWLQMSRANGSYPVGGRYGIGGFGSRALYRVVDTLADLGFIEQRPGFYNRDTSTGYQTRIRGLGSLQKALRRVSVDALARPRTELIVLKDSKKRLIDYAETEQSERLRANVEAYNALLDQHSIADPAAGHIEFFRSRRVNPTRRHYYRTFNGSFDLGGRFYGPWWQVIPKRDRVTLTIDADPVVELDYQAMNVHLAYSVAGRSFWDEHPGVDDPYELPGFEMVDRAIRKKAVLLSLNAESPEQAINAILGDAMKSGYSVRGVPLRDMVDRIREWHSALSEILFRKSGLRLMRMESIVSEWIISQCIQAPICALNIHDGYVVRQGDARFLECLMTGAFDNLCLTSVPEVSRA